MRNLPVAALRHEQEQDEANALQWWRETADLDKMRVWDAIQAMGGTTEWELISRFAQIGMTHIALLAGSLAVSK